MTSGFTADFRRTLDGGLQVAARLDGPVDVFHAVVLFGPSGAGKTTILRALAGLDRIDTGSIACDGVVWADAARDIHLPPRARSIGFVAQDDDLFPHLSALENVAFGAAGGAAERRAEAAVWLARFGLSGKEDRMPRSLSGGERRRVALARAAARKPKLLLLDEPFSALDHAVRREVRRDLRAALAPLGTTVLLVTHDAEEALSFADEAVLVDAGAIVQRGPVAEVFSQPNGAAAARITGVETVVAGEVLGGADGVVRVSAGRAVLLASAADAAPGPALVCIRADAVLLGRTAGDTSARNVLSGPVVSAAPSGGAVRVVVDVGFPLSALVTRAACEDLGVRPGVVLFAFVKAPHVHVVGRGTAAGVG
jgi:molybdate transport system ATP-binding protein